MVSALFYKNKATKRLENSKLKWIVLGVTLSNVFWKISNISKVSIFEYIEKQKKNSLAIIRG